MSGEIAAKNNQSTVSNSQNTNKFVNIILNNHIFAFSALAVEDVLPPQKISPIPLASQEIIGLLNLRGRVVTAIDLGIKMGITQAQNYMNNKSIVVEYNNNLYSFIVDDVTGVSDIPDSAIEPVPDNISHIWKKYCTGVYKSQKELVLILNIENLLHHDKN